MSKRNVFWTTIFWVLFLTALWKAFFVFFLVKKSTISLWIGALAGAMALLYSALKAKEVFSESPGNDLMQEISNHIYIGAMTFLKREYMVLSVFVVIVAVLLAVFIDYPHTSNLISTMTPFAKIYKIFPVTICFITGALCSSVAGYLGMTVSTKANARTAHAADTSLNKAFKTAFAGGSVMGMCLVGLGLLMLTILFYIYKDYEIISGFALGASCIALFARVGGGIFTKAADIGADLAGKLEADIPEDDYRNPAVIADNVGDNVGDVAGMGADLFESYAGSLIAAITLGALCLNVMGAILPIVIAGLGIFASIIGTVVVRTKEKGNPMAALRLGVITSMIILLIGSFGIIKYWFGFNEAYIGIFCTIVIGIITGLVIGLSTEYFTSYNYLPVKRIVDSTKTGVATTVIEGLGTGMFSVFIPLVTISIATVSSFLIIGGMHNYILGVFGIALAALGMLSASAIIIAIDAYGPIADNAGGIAQMANMSEETRKRTDKLDAAGNTTAAVGKGFAIGSAALTALALLVSYATVINLENIDVLNPFVISGILFGACLPFLFCALTMKATGRAASKMVKEIRRQFNEIPGIMKGHCKPDYKCCIDISTKAALFEMILPGIIAIGAPILVGGGVTLFTSEKILGAQALGGMLTGAIVTGVCLAIMMANTGGAFDNAKKYIEKGHSGGKNSLSHDAAVIGDTIGDPLKDTAGPSLNILIKLMTIVSLVCATLFIK